MRICSPQLGLSPDSMLGGEVHDREVLLGLADRGWKVDMLLPKDRRAPSHPNFSIEYLPMKTVFPPYIFNFFVFRYLMKLFHVRPFDIIRVHDPHFVGLGALAFRRHHPRIPIIAMYHHLESAFSSWIDYSIDQFIIHQWDAIITPSVLTKEELIDRYHVAEEKIHVFFSGVDKDLKSTRNRDSLRHRWGLVGRCVLLFFGRLIPRKNPSFALETLSHIDDETVVLLIAGDGPLLPFLKLRARQMGLSKRVWFVGRVQEEDKAGIFSLADVLLFPSLREGFGMVPFESLLCRTVPLVHEKTASASFLQGNTYGFSLPLVPRQWAEVIRRLLRDPRKRQYMAMEGRKMVQREFSWDMVAEKNDQLYRKLIAR